MSGPGKGPQASPHQTSLLTGLFFVTGATSLVFEVLWVRGLTLVVGNTTFAVSVVVAAFLGGLAIGNALAGQWSLKIQHPLRAYAIAEGLAGLLALGLTLLLPRLSGLLAAVGLPGGGPVAARLVLVALLMAPPTIVMGASLPMLASWVGRALQSAGVEIGRLYTVNTLGAAFGCALAGFFLIGALGVSTTALVACAANLLVGAVALTMARASRS